MTSSVTSNRVVIVVIIFIKIVAKVRVSHFGSPTTLSRAISASTYFELLYGGRQGKGVGWGK